MSDKFKRKIVVSHNKKGGVGKSTWSVHAAAGLATRGYRIGLVDADSQGHCADMLGLPEMDGLYMALIDRKPLDQCVIPVEATRYSAEDYPARGALYLLPSGPFTYSIPRQLPQNEPFLFLQRLEEMIYQYDLDALIIDTPPTVSDFDGPLFLAADAYLYVTECERLSLQGIITSVEQMQRAANSRQQYLGRESKILGIIPNKMRVNTLVHQNNVGSLVKHFGDLAWPPVPLRTMWTEASNDQQTIFTYAPNGKEAVDAWTIVQRIEEGLCS